jgi:COP9 signalosome complex subunit 8
MASQGSSVVSPPTPPTPAPPANEPPSLINPATANVVVNPFRIVFGDIAHFAEQNRWDDVVRLCEDADLTKQGDDQPSRLLVTAPLVLAYLIQNDLPPARFALTRLPPTVVSQPLSQHLFGLFASTSDRKYTNVYSRAAAILSMCTPGSTTLDAELAVVVGHMIQAFLDGFRNRTLKLLAKAYSSIPLPVAQYYLGLAPEQILEVTNTSGQWTYDAGKQTLTPVANSNTVNGIKAPTCSDLSVLESSTRSAARLESIL